MVSFDSETLFNGAAAAISTVAVLMFVFSVDFGYSPVTRVALVVAFLAGVFAITQRSRDFQLTVLGYGVVVVSTLSLVFYVTDTFDVGTTATVFVLLVVAGVLFGLRTRLDEDSHFVTGERATRVFGVVAALAVLVLVVDVATGGLAYELQPENEAEFTDVDREEVQIASVLVTNPTPLPERVDVPRYEACAAGNWSAFRPPSEPDGPPREVRVHASVLSPYDDHVLGFDSKTYPVVLHVDGENLRGETFPVRTTDGCPDGETGEPYVALFEGGEDRRFDLAL